MTYANAAAVLVDWIAECGGEEQAIDFLAAWLADGNSMKALVDTYALTWGVLAAWIRNDSRRNVRYEQALRDRGAIRKERLLDGWWQVASIAVPENEATHGDVHKAREALAKAEGMFREMVEVTGKDGAPLLPADREARLLEVARGLAFIMTAAARKVEPEKGRTLDVVPESVPRETPLSGPELL